jgi:2-haloacid dehalogenase
MRWATFDCYGTLIDWEGGIAGELNRLFGHGDLLGRYHEIEPQVQREDPSRSYRDVLALALERVAASASLELPASERDALACSLPRWAPFAEVPGALRALRDRGWRLAILSNTDRDLIDASMARIGVPFELAVVAGEIGSYKPAHRHWEEFFARTNAPRDRHVHVGASHYHDVAPAVELGIPCVWINRHGERAEPRPTRELPTLAALPETLDELVPP